MSGTLDDRLRRHYDERTSHLPHHGPGLDTIIVRSSPFHDSRQHRSRIPAMIGVAAALIATSLILVNRLSSDTAVSNPATTESAAPTATAPTAIVGGEPVDSSAPPSLVTDGVPVTVSAGSPLSFWQFLPNLAIAERETSAGSGTELCWRTSAGTGCLDDTFVSPEVGVIPTDSGVIFLARPSLALIVPPPSDPSAPTFELKPSPTKITARLSDGSTVTAAVQYRAEFGVGYASLTLPAGVTLVSASSS